MDLSLLLFSLQLNQRMETLLYTQSKYGGCEDGCGQNSPIIGNEIYLGKQITNLNRSCGKNYPPGSWPEEFDDDSSSPDLKKLRLVGATLNGERAVVGINGHHLMAWTTKNCGETWKMHRGKELIGKNGMPLTMYTEKNNGKRYAIKLVHFLKDEHKFWWDPAIVRQIKVPIPGAPSYQFQLVNQKGTTDICPLPDPPDERLELVRDANKSSTEWKLGGLVPTGPTAPSRPTVPTGTTGPTGTTVPSRPIPDILHPGVPSRPIPDILHPTAYHAIFFTGDRYNLESKLLSDSSSECTGSSADCTPPGPKSNSPDKSGSYTQRWMNIACNNTATQKMHLAGKTSAAVDHINETITRRYRTIAKSSDKKHISSQLGHIQVEAREKQALLNAITANYCRNYPSDNASPLTVPGQRLEYAHIRHEFDIPPIAGRYEAIWNENGAICISTPRRSEAISENVIRERIRKYCPNLRDCSSFSQAEWKNALGTSIAHSALGARVPSTPNSDFVLDRRMTVGIEAQELINRIRVKPATFPFSALPFRDHFNSGFLDSQLSPRIATPMECSARPLSTRAVRCKGPPKSRSNPIFDLHSSPQQRRETENAMIITFLPTTCLIKQDNLKTVCKKENSNEVKFLGCSCGRYCGDDTFPCCPDYEFCLKEQPRPKIQLPKILLPNDSLH